ncbi:MAG: cell division protein FtsL [Ignavibacteria bacterium]|nr:cell division protein FtsL [Ignavibacteria bacterium]
MKPTRTKISIFWMIVFFITFSAISVFLINNIISVNKLNRDISELKDNLGKVNQTNNSYRIEIEKLSSYDRIKKLAEEKLNLKVYEGSVKTGSKIKIKKSDM